MATLGEVLNQARQLLSGGRLIEAQAVYRQIVDSVPQFPDAWHELGIAHLQAGQHGEAAGCLRRAVELEPQNVSFLSNLGAACRMFKRHDEAVASFERALAIGPPTAELYNNLALALKDAGQTDRALAAFDEAIRLRPDYANGHFNRANLLAAVGRIPEAIPGYQRAVDLNPADAGALCQLGVAYADIGDCENALAAFERSLAIKPDYAETRRNRAFVWLAQGRYAEGWREFEWRLKCEELITPAYPQPLWDGSPLAGRTLLVYAEQGLGDTMQFMRYLPSSDVFGGRVVVPVPKTLIPLLTQSGFGRWIVPRDAPVEFDVHCPLLSFPYLLGRDEGRPYWNGPYLRPDPALVERWREPIRAISGFRVGIAWAGNPEYVHDRYRSIQLEAFEPLARVPGVRLISLQKSPSAADRSRMAGAMNVVYLGDEVDQGGAFLDTSAVIEHLDLVVAVNSSVAHLSGALGAKVWMPLQRSVDWRWPTAANETPWYPSMRIFHQRQFNQWPAVFEEMAQTLTPLARG